VGQTTLRTGGYQLSSARKIFEIVTICYLPMWKHFGFLSVTGLQHIASGFENVAERIDAFRIMMLRLNLMGKIEKPFGVIY
jgi:hypothetical protein